MDLVHRCFVRMFEGDGSSPPAAPSVRVINLSIGDPARMFARQLSPLARLLDWLTFKYNRIVVVSAGNHATGVGTLVANLGDLLCARPDVAEVEINPLRLTGGGLIALDAVLTVLPEDPRDRSGREAGPASTHWWS